jgi:hypothetical protein
LRQQSTHFAAGKFRRSFERRRNQGAVVTRRQLGECRGTGSMGSGLLTGRHSPLSTIDPAASARPDTSAISRVFPRSRHPGSTIGHYMQDADGRALSGSNSSSKLDAASGARLYLSVGADIAGAAMHSTSGRLLSVHSRPQA